MKKRIKALPSIVNEYGCRPPDREAEVVEQMRLANRYRNSLCEIELHRREACNAVVHVEELAAMKLDIEQADARIKEIFTARKARNAKLRRKTALTAEEKSEVTALKERLKSMGEAYKLRKKEAYGSAENKIALDAINEAAHASIIEARRIASHDWGLYWGTYTLTEAACMSFRIGAPPRFRGFRGDGQIGAQIQSNASTRVTTEDIAEFGECLQFRIAKTDKRHANVSILMGGENPQKRISANNPARYATVRATIHRPLPEGAHVSWVRLVRRKIGTNFKWFVQFILARAEGWGKPHGEGRLGIDDMPEPMADGSIRVARWVGHDGDSGELRLPADLVRSASHKTELQSLHDEKTNVAKAALLAWYKAVDRETLPAWFVEATKTLPAWRGASRFAGLIIKWRDNRFPGDEGIFETMEAYRKQAKHLWNWACHEHAKALRRRSDLYRNTARALARKYGSAAVAARKTPVVRAEHERLAATASFRSALEHGGLSVVVISAGAESAPDLLRGLECEEKARDLSTEAAQ